MSCPVPSAHRRLDDAHAAWHDALDAYTDPHGFRRHLNEFLAAFGSTKDMISRQKRQLPEGVSKLSEWEANAKKVPYAVWAQKSRNMIIHENDLVLHSWAETEYVDTATFRGIAPRQRVAPTLSTEDLLQAVVMETPPHFEQCVVAVTRKWVAESLPHAELLTVGSVLYSLLCSLVSSFHESGTDCSELEVPERPCRPSARDAFDRPSCMVLASPSITRYFDVHSQNELSLEVHSIERDPTISSAVLQERYGPLGALSGDPIQVAPQQLRMAEKFLSVDSEATPWMIVFKDNRIADVFPVHYRDQVDKVVMYRVMAQRMKSLGADGFVFSGEIWTRHHPGRKRRIHSHEKTYYDVRADRDEALVVCAATRDGRQLMMTREILRDESGWPSPGRIDSFPYVDRQWNPLIDAITGLHNHNVFNRG